jgi:prepilin-type processing-associated H-X9-DG protein
LSIDAASTIISRSGDTQMFIRSLVAASSVFAFASICPAQPLAERVPESAIVYMGWRGANELRADYEKSHLKGVLAESRVSELPGPFLDQWLRVIAKRTPDVAAEIGAIRDIVGHAWAYPTAFFLSDIADAEGLPAPRGSILCRAGADAPALLEKLRSSIGKSPELTANTKLFQLDDVVCVAFGYGPDEMALAGEGNDRPRPLSASAGFVANMKQVLDTPAYVVHVNTVRLREEIERAMADSAPDDAKQVFRNALTQLGVDQLGAVTHASGFVDAEWHTRTFVDLPSPRTGMASLLDAKADFSGVFQTIPADATTVSTFNFDAHAFVQQLRISAKATQEDAGKGVDMGLGALQAALGVDPLGQILEPLGPVWAIYCSPTVGGNGVTGIILVNKLDDPAKFRKGLVRASFALNNLASAGVGKATEGNMTFRGNVTKLAGQEIYYLGTPVVSPCWTVAGDHLYVSLFTHHLAAATRFTASGRPTFDTTDAYKSHLQKLGGKSDIGMSYFDLPAVAGTGYMNSGMPVIFRYAGISDLFGVPAPEPLMPPLDTLLAHLVPSGSTTYVSDAGVHIRGITPFPGATALNESIACVKIGVPAIAMSIGLPAMNNARKTANHVKSATNLRSIGQMAIMHSMNNGGRLPETFGDLVVTDGGLAISAALFINPLTDTSAPAFPEGKEGVDALAEWVDFNSDYEWLAGGLNTAQLKTPSHELAIAYERGDFGENIYVLFADGHVELLAIDDAAVVIEQSRQKIDEIRINQK